MLKLVDVNEKDIVLCAQDDDNNIDNLDALFKTRDKFHKINCPEFHEF